ncbi:hypothetical protein [Richelia sinica]|uniref:hypothetical protein n=1 Tax=Richelia sinica TaxID=1357545 RepID=UPI001F55A77A|nr:hypothetical protein [Richelia sinica]
MDNDVIRKLVACSLFSEAISSLELDETDLRVLPDAKYVLRKNKEIRKTHPENVINSAIAIIEKCPKIQLIAPNEELEEIRLNEIGQLQTIEGIDSGEQIIITATRFEESFYVTTGDKRWTTALTNAPQLGEIRERLIGRVICFEQLILKSIDSQGFDKVLNRVLPARYCDTALRAAFGSGEKSTEENVKQALQGYIEHLQTETKGLLAEI